MRKALLYESSESGALCTLCEELCCLRDGETGPCGVRQCRSGDLYTRAAGGLSSIQKRRIERLGFYHVRPGRSALLAVPGATLRTDPAKVHLLLGAGGRREVELRCRARDLAGVASMAGCEALAFGILEPTFYMETVVDAFDGARCKGLYTLLQTGGAMTPEALDVLAPLTDAASVCVPTMRESSARRQQITPPHLLRASIRGMRERGLWVEVTTVLVPGLNDNPIELREVAESLAHIDPLIPWHLRHTAAEDPFLDCLDPPQAILAEAARMGQDSGLHHVYVPGDAKLGHELTFCPHCPDVVLIERFQGQPGNAPRGRWACPRCGVALHGLFEQPPLADLVP